MKFVALIMAFLILALSVMPCADAGAVTTDTKAKTEINKTTDQQHHNANDACSPFCHCSCCSGFSISLFVAAVAIIPQYESNTISSFLPSDVREVALPIWQPPRSC